MAARSIGHFVPLSQALNVPPKVCKPSTENDALEADYAWTLRRLGIDRRRDWSKKSDMASWHGDLEETAFIHAARAGVQYVASGETLPISGHISAFPKLLERFELAAALARFEVKQQPAEGTATD